MVLGAQLLAAELERRDLELAPAGTAILDRVFPRMAKSLDSSKLLAHLPTPIRKTKWAFRIRQNVRL